MDLALPQLLSRIDRTRAEHLSGFPHYADASSGGWITTPDGFWTGGYWVGELWLAGHIREDPEMWRDARRWLSRLGERLRSPSLFRAFLFYYGATLGTLVAADGWARSMGVEAAGRLSTTFDERLGLLPLGAAAEEASDVGDAEASIDGLIATPLLLWAHHETADSALLEIGRAHASRCAELLIRDDGSVCQSVSFDPDGGSPTRWYTHKGSSDSSTWGRAQAWGLLGFALAALWDPGEPQHLASARRVADWWLERVPSDLVAYWDFDVPQEPPTERDTSASAIAAAGLIKLSRLVPPQDAERYLDGARQTVATLLERHVTPVGEEDARSPGMLVDGCFNRRDGVAPANELIWGDYYLLESVAALSGHFDLEGTL